MAGRWKAPAKKWHRALPGCPFFFACVMGNSCYRCKEQNLPLCVWEFHHMDPLKKEVTVTQLLANSWPLILEEIKKCVLLCANCHRIIHYGEEALNGI